MPHTRGPVGFYGDELLTLQEQHERQQDELDCELDLARQYEPEFGPLPRLDDAEGEPDV